MGAVISLVKDVVWNSEGVWGRDGNLEPTPNGGCWYVRRSIWKMTTSFFSAKFDSDSLVLSSPSPSHNAYAWHHFGFPPSLSLLCFLLALMVLCPFSLSSRCAPFLWKIWADLYPLTVICEFNMNLPFWSSTGGMSLGIGK